MPRRTPRRPGNAKRSITRWFRSNAVQLPVFACRCASSGTDDNSFPVTRFTSSAAV